jgi:ectoine hydroxylase
MKLTPEQLAQFDRDGYLFFPGLFKPDEIKTLTDEVPALYAQHRPENIREKAGGVVRTNFAAHLYSKPFAKLGRHPRMIEPVQQIFGNALYMHQFKINGKAAFDGDVWQWHQDYGTWKNDDLMPEARAMNVAIFLDEVNEFNGPLMFIPGSHKQGVLDA